MVSAKLVPFMRNAVNEKIRNGNFDCGFANGYVAVPQGHPLWGKSYEVANNCVDVHGGVTFGGAYDKNFVENIIRLSDDEIPEDSWVFGFDTLHFMDNSVNCDETFCRVETMNFLKQLENIGKIG